MRSWAARQSPHSQDRFYIVRIRATNLVVAWCDSRKYRSTRAHPNKQVAHQDGYGDHNTRSYRMPAEARRQRAL